MKYLGPSELDKLTEEEVKIPGLYKLLTNGYYVRYNEAGSEVFIAVRLMPNERTIVWIHNKNKRIAFQRVFKRVINYCRGELKPAWMMLAELLLCEG
jgi:hypothetical protein